MGGGWVLSPSDHIAADGRLSKLGGGGGGGGGIVLPHTVQTIFFGKYDY